MFAECGCPKFGLWTAISSPKLETQGTYIYTQVYLREINKLFCREPRGIQHVQRLVKGLDLKPLPEKKERFGGIHIRILKTQFGFRHFSCIWPFLECFSRMPRIQSTIPQIVTDLNLAPYRITTCFEYLLEEELAVIIEVDTFSFELWARYRRSKSKLWTSACCQHAHWLFEVQFCFYSYIRGAVLDKLQGIELRSIDRTSCTLAHSSHFRIASSSRPPIISTTGLGVPSLSPALRR